jgi:hypothetical protein
LVFAVVFVLVGRAFVDCAIVSSLFKAVSHQRSAISPDLPGRSASVADS